MPLGVCAGTAGRQMNTLTGMPPREGVFVHTAGLPADVNQARLCVFNFWLKVTEVEAPPLPSSF